MQLAVSPADFRRLERFLPRGLSAASAENPVERAAGYLARMVLSHQLAPGHKIPMDEIADRIGASRTPVREALRALEMEGLVASVPNRGFVMRRLDPVDARHLYDARRCIESFLARCAFANRTRPFVQELKALHRVYAGVLEGDSDRRRLGMLVDKAFHLRIAEQAANPHLTALLANVFDRLILTRPIEGFPPHRMAAAVAEHAAIVAAYDSGTEAAAEKTVLRNIEKGGAAIVSHLHSLRQFTAAGS